MIIRYSIQNNLEEFIYLSPVKSFLLMQTYLVRTYIADAADQFVDVSDEAVNMIRMQLGLYPKNF